MTRSTRASSAGGTASPSFAAASLLIVRLIFSGCSIGIALARVPYSTRSTKTASLPKFSIRPGP